MDRQIPFAILFAVIATSVLSSFYFDRPAVAERPQYAKDDIRFAIDQKKKTTKKKSSSQASPAASVSDHDTSSDEGFDDPSNEEPPAEEPPIE